MKAKYIYESVNFERGEDPRRTLGISEEPAKWEIFVATRESSTNLNLSQTTSREIERDIDGILKEIIENENIKFDDILNTDFEFFRDRDWNHELCRDGAIDFIKGQFPEAKSEGEIWDKWWDKNIRDDYDRDAERRIEAEVKDKIEKWEYQLPPGKLEEIIKKLLK
jgi:hypothetical protein